MNGIYTKQDFIKYANKQIENNNDKLKAIKVMEQVAKEMDGKQLNRRYIDKVNEQIKNIYNLERTSIVFDTTGYSNEKCGFMIYSRDNDSYKTSDEQFASWNYVDYDTPIYFGTLDKTIDASKFIETLARAETNIKTTNEQFAHDIAEIETAEQEYKRIKTEIDNFNSKYGYILTNLYKL